MLQIDPIFLKFVITGDENCVHQFDLLTKSVTSAWQYIISLLSKKIQQTKSAGKVMIPFFDYNEVIYRHSVPSKSAKNW